ncbi:MAG TPA: hypothetical protein VIS96_05280 [Terrimicrobiaceae bacterium]
MKASVLWWIISTIPLFASDPVDIGSFDYRGKTYSNAKATLLSTEKVQIVSSRGASVVIPWKEANAFVRFQLKSQREEMLSLEEQEEPEKTPEIWMIRGSVAAVFPDGIAIHCDLPEEHSPVRTGAFASVGGFVTKRVLGEQLKAATGDVFVRGLKGFANQERVYLQAVKTEDTRAIGETETLRVFVLPAIPRDR